MSESKRNQPPLVAPERAEAIQAFGVELAALCGKYGLEIRSELAIEIIDNRRGTPMPDGYEWSAEFDGCDEKGIYDAETRERVPIEIADLMEEDWWQA